MATDVAGTDEMNAYEKLEAHFEEINRLGQMLAVLGWDWRTMMPAGGTQARSEQIAMLRSMIHERLRRPTIPQWLAEAEDDDELGGWQRANLREMKRRHKHASCVPAELIERKSRKGTECEMIWRTAREDDDFDRLAPHLQEVLELSREIAEIKADAFDVEPYDALLDRYEPEMTSRKLDELFDDLAEFLPGFVEEVLERQRHQPDVIELDGPFAEKRQDQLARQLMRALGFDFEQGRLDTSAHPFCGGYSTDVRLTTSYDEDNFLRAIMAVLHETGHALYNSGLPDEWLEQPVGRPRGMGVHESQSLLVEMQIGRSRSFVKWAAPLYRKAFDGDGKAWSVDNLYRRKIRVRRSLIRVDADEVTYPLHVILRYRLERALIAGTLEIDELPEAWKSMMAELVGIEPDDDRDGCMQDIHWMDGTFGYFPTYTLGALMSAQLFESLREDVADVDEAIADGEFSPIVDWLRNRVHSRASRWSTQMLLEKATGRGLETDSYKAHLRRRYLGEVD